MAVKYDACTHAKITKHHDENDDRIRACHYCTTCMTYWFGCFAKRLDADGNEAWGSVGVWHWSEHTLTHRELQ